MKRIFPIALLLVTISAAAATDRSVVETVSEDSRVIRRVAQVGGRDMPREVMRKIVQEDIDLLRGKRNDGTYQYAHYEREEADRNEENFRVRKGDKLTSGQIRGAWVYRLIIEVPNRKLVVAKNRRAYIDRVEIDFQPMEGSARRNEVVPVQEWLVPGDRKEIDIPDIAREAIVKVYARVDEEDKGYSAIDLALLKAKLVDNSDSPYYASVQAAKQLLSSVKNQDAATVRRHAEAMGTSIDARFPLASGTSIAVDAPAPPVTPLPPVTTTTRTTTTTTSLEAPPNVEVYMELQAIEDLLTGAEPERREGLDRLHQLIRKMRPPR